MMTIEKSIKIREYYEGYDVEIEWGDARDGNATRYVIKAYNEGGHNSVHVDLIDVVNYVKRYHPELITEEHT